MSIHHCDVLCWLATDSDNGVHDLVREAQYSRELLSAFWD